MSQQKPNYAKQERKTSRDVEGKHAIFILILSNEIKKKLKKERAKSILKSIAISFTKKGNAAGCGFSLSFSSGSSLHR